MAEYISSFIVGFENIVLKRLPVDLPGVNIHKVYNGLVQYSYKGNYNKIKRVVYLSNTFCVYKKFMSNQLSFERMVSITSAQKYDYAIKTGSFRIRFSRENQFCKVDKKISSMAEKHVCCISKLRLDRLNPSTEMWYIIRSEGIGFYCQLLFRRETTEKNLNKGELRPEFAFLLCCCAALDQNETVCDPFCGYGSIPKQVTKWDNINKIYVSDIDRSKISRLKNSDIIKDKRIHLRTSDALKLTHIKTNEVDTVITDPPWGKYEDVQDISLFYDSMLEELIRIVKKGGKIVLLTSQKEEFIKCCEKKMIIIDTQINTLVNGKKAAVFILINQKPN